MSRLVIAARVAGVRLSIWVEKRTWHLRRRVERRPDDRPMLIHPEDLDLAEEMVGPLGPVVMTLELPDLSTVRVVFAYD